MGEESKSPYRKVKDKKHWGARLFLVFLVFCLIFYCGVQLLLGALFAKMNQNATYIRSEDVVLPAISDENVCFPQYRIKKIRDELAIMENVECRLEEMGDVAAGDLSSAYSSSYPIYEREQIDENVINILLLGRDTRANESSRGRSDTMILLSYNKQKNTVTLASFLRDSWVTIGNRGENKLNATFSWGGVGLTINTINDLYDLDIQRYAVVGFYEMIALVDVLGGVGVDLNEDEAAYYREVFGWNVKAGHITLTGEQALVHCRNRKVGNGDFDRARRQQDVLKSIYSRMASMDNPVKIGEFAVRALGEVETNMESEEILDLLLDALLSGNSSIDQITIPADGTWTGDTIDGKSVIVFDPQENEEILKTELYGS